MAQETVHNPYPVASAAAEAFDAWISARYTLITCAKSVMQLTQERRKALEAHTTRMCATGKQTAFLWLGQEDYIQAVQAEAEAVQQLAHAEYQLIDCTGDLPVIYLQW